MCHQSMKFSDRFDQNPPCTFNKITKKTLSNGKRSHGLTLRAKVKVIAKSKENAAGSRGGRHNSKVFLQQRTYICLSHSTN